MLGHFGRFMARHRWWVIGFWLVLLVVAAPLAKNVTHNLSAAGFEWPGSRSVWAGNQLSYVRSSTGASPVLLQHVSYGTAASWAQRFAIPRSDWHRLSGGQAVMMPTGVPAGRFLAFTRYASGHGAQVTAVGDGAVAVKVIQETKATLGDSLPLALPILIVLLLLVFGTVAAAVLPLVVAGAGALVSLAVVDLLENHITLSAYLTDIVSFLALGVGVDYALFISARYRQALDRHPGDRLAAVDEAMGHAGRSVLFSGLAVAMALATLTLGGNSYWRGIALGGAVAVAAVLVATHTLLPAVLGVLGDRINWGRVALGRVGGFWDRVAGAVKRHPGWAFLAAVVLLGVPATQGPAIRMATPANLAVLLPASDPLRQAVFLGQRVNGPGSSSPLIVAVTLPEPVTSPKAWVTLAQLADRIGRDGTVAKVVTPTSLAAPTVLALAARGSTVVPTALRTTLDVFVSPARRPHLAILYVTSRAGPDAAATTHLVNRLDRQLSRWLPGQKTGVGGVTALLNGFNTLTALRLPWIIAGVAAVALVVLFAATGSIWQALLGVAFDGLVALATAGLLVVTVQRGGLGLAPLEPDSGVTPLIFVLLFGLSMDYEVILLHRVQEHLRAGLSARDAASEAVRGTGGMITGAGMIMVVVFLALILSPLEIMKTLAIGMTAAILLDTWLVRSLMVPSTTIWLNRQAFWPWGRARALSSDR